MVIKCRYLEQKWLKNQKLVVFCFRFGSVYLPLEVLSVVIWCRIISRVVTCRRFQTVKSFLFGTAFSVGKISYKYLNFQVHHELQDMLELYKT
jgi:hypothetical protein